MQIPDPFPSIFLVELPLSRWTFDFGSSGFPFLRDELFLFPHLINSIIILTTSSSLIWNISIYYISQIIYYIAIVFIFVFIFISHLWGKICLWLVNSSNSTSFSFFYYSFDFPEPWNSSYGKLEISTSAPFSSSLLIIELWVGFGCWLWRTLESSEFYSCWFGSIRLSTLSLINYLI